MATHAEMKLSDAALSWLDMRDAGTSRARYLKPRTFRTYRLELEAPASSRHPRLGSPLTAVQSLCDQREQLRRRGKPVKDQYVRAIRKVNDSVQIRIPQL
jgi:hypothetical protein